jgi:hypothetical protein
MKRRAAAACLGQLLCLWAIGLSGCASPGTEAAHSGSGGTQILVMVPIAPVHFRAGASYGAGYDPHVGRSARIQLGKDLAQAQAVELLSDWPMPSLFVDCFVMDVPAGRPVEPVLEALNRDARVAWAQALHAYRALGPADPLLALQPSAAAWHLAEVHKFATGRAVTVAVVDSGVELGHPDLAGRIGVARNFVDASAYAAESHGTAVAGIIAADADNGIGIAGVAPQAQLMALRACWQIDETATACNSFTLAKAMEFALQNHAQVINLSLAGPQDRLLGRLLDAAQARGTAVVCAMDPTLADGGFPASHPGVIAVTAGEDADAPGAVSAPGRDIPATLPGAQWGFVSGSSFAAAQISGVVALLRELAPSLSAQQARAWLLAAGLRAAPQASAGRPTSAVTDVCAVLAQATDACMCDCAGGATGASAAGAAVVFRR